MQLMNHFNSDK